MRHRSCLSLCWMLLSLIVMPHPQMCARAGDSAQARTRFANPPRQYSSGPLWTWNDMLTEEQIVSTLGDLAGQHVKQVWVHPRPGLMTPYLSDDWFRLWKVALKEAERLDMNVWIYDENSYPSGFAGGLVPEAMPESRGQGLVFRETKKPPESADDVVAVFRAVGDSYQNVSKAFHAGETLPKGGYLVASTRLSPTGGWFGGKYYVDLLYPGVTQKFLEITMDAYRREIGDQFGKRVPGVFTDEPHLAPAGGLHWSDHLPQLFQERFGYSLIDHLPSLVRPVGDWKRVRHNYYQLLLEQFIDCWAKPFYEYCEKHNLEFTGHYWEHGWPDAGHGGDNMAMYAWHQRPAIDTLMNQYREDVNAQFGNVRAVLELASVANQLGRRRTLCEAYGAGGWDLRFEDMKRIGDWLYVLGVNTLNEHLSYVTIRGARKHDHPLSFSYHEPWWDAYHVMAQYFTRLSLVLTEGEQVNRILVLEPTTTSWMYQSAPELKALGDQFQSLVTRLAKDQVEFDIGCEDIMGRNGSADGGELIIGERRYDTVVFPAKVENLNAKTVTLLEAYLKAGGVVLSGSPPPSRVDGSPSDRPLAFAKQPGFRQIDLGTLSKTLLERADDGFAVRQKPDDQGILFHHRRRLDDGEFLFLANTSIESPCSGQVRTKCRGMERWDLQTGQILPQSITATPAGVTTDFELPPCGSLLLFLTKDSRDPVEASKGLSSPIPALGPMQVRRKGPNVLTLDYVDVSAGGQTKKNQHFFAASTFVFQQNGMEGNPWSRAVQFRDELITKTFPADSGFEATYRFTVKERVPRALHIVIERPDLYRITCNGKPVTAEPGAWWLDKSFGKIGIASAARVGDNAVTISASPFTMYHELEPAYVLGEFTLEPAESGFVIAPDRPLRLEQRLAHGNAIEGMMWLSAGIGYHRSPDAKSGNDRDPFVVFDLGRPSDLRRIKVWNYNEVNVPTRGVKDVAVTGSKTGESDSFTIPIGTFTLDRASGDATELGQWLDVEADGVRFVKFDILSNHGGSRFPATGNRDSAFVGLSEVQFYAASGAGDGAEKISPVKIHQVSSELLNGHNRRAAFLVDGSGLGMKSVGWNHQGHPFHATGVSYAQEFQVDRPTGRYAVALPDWYGSMARVLVNGKPVGYIAYQPWECDVTDGIKAGRNRIEVVVVGTLKNTLGPHHAGALRGSAWPHAFQRGPQTGPPPGRQYDTLDYGLFEPFVLRCVKD